MTILMKILATLLFLQLTIGEETTAIISNTDSTWVNLTFTNDPKLRAGQDDCDELRAYICVLELHRNRVDLAAKMFRQFKNYENYDLLNTIVKQAYANNINNLFKLINFILALPWCNHQYIGFVFLVQEFKNSGHMYTQESIRFAYKLRNPPNCLPDPPILERFSNLRHSFPGGIKAVIWNNQKVCIKSYVYKENLYASGYKFNKERRRVFTWISKAQQIGPEKEWTFDLMDDGSFTIRNTFYQEYLYASGDEYNKERRYVFTWVPKNPVSQGYWQLEPIKGSDFCRLRNIYYNSYYYSAQCCQYDKQNRNIFTWTPKTQLGDEAVWELSAC